MALLMGAAMAIVGVATEAEAAERPVPDFEASLDR